MNIYKHRNKKDERQRHRTKTFLCQPTTTTTTAATTTVKMMTDGANGWFDFPGGLPGSCNVNAVNTASFPTGAPALIIADTEVSRAISQKHRGTGHLLMARQGHPKNHTLDTNGVRSGALPALLAQSHGSANGVLAKRRRRCPNRMESITWKRRRRPNGMEAGRWKRRGRPNQMEAPKAPSSNGSYLSKFTF